MADGGELAPRPERAPPVPYSEEVAEAICRALATTPRGIEYLCRTRPDFPDYVTVWRWRVMHPDFAHAFDVAKAMQLEMIVDQALEIADDASGDVMVVTRRDGSEERVMDREFVARSDLKVKTRFKYAHVLAPKRYGGRSERDGFGGVACHDDILDELD